MYLGIDLGTSNSAISANTGSDVRILKNSDGSDVLPSVIYIDKRGHRLFGQRAYEQTMMSPDNVAKGFKRLMGTSTAIEFSAAGITMSAEECSAEILRQLVGQALLETNNAVIEGAAVTIPAAFNQMQSEATLRAANAAGLDRVVLLQEPVAAAMAAMARVKNNSGQFIVYDLGGGTFDLALVQSLSGSVNIVGHEGINMLGGQDFDRIIINSVVRPWLLETFSLPADFQKDERYRRLLGKASIAAEIAKIELSKNETTTIFRSDEDIRLKDEDGNDIYLEVELSRAHLETLIEPSLNQTIELTRKIIKDNGYSNQDIDRIVFVGGPSRMPWIRERIPQELGIPCDTSVDPMTTVSIGAAIYAESREWESNKPSRKATRASALAGGGVNLKYDFLSRTADGQVKLRVKADGSAVAARLVIQVDSESTGWTSGRIPVTHDVVVDIALLALGENVFRVTVFDDAGRPIDTAGTTLKITKTYATATAIPATQTISVKVRAGATRLRNILHPLIKKGTPLPASGKEPLQAAFALSQLLPGRLDLELYQDEGSDDPELNLAIGSLRITEKDLPEGLSIKEGDEVIFHWTMDESGVLTGSVELPSVQQTFNAKRFYVDQAGHQSFDGESGEKLVDETIRAAETHIAGVAQALGGAAESELEQIEQNLELQRTRVHEASSGDERRSIAENVRHIRQQAALVKSRPDLKGRYLEYSLSEVVKRWDKFARPKADKKVAEQFDQQATAALNELRRRTPAAFEAAETLIDQMEGMYWRSIWSQPENVVAIFRTATGQRHMAVDKAAFDMLVIDGERAIKADDTDELRQIISDIWNGQITTAEVRSDIAKLASVMRG